MDNENQWVMTLVAMVIPLAISVAFTVVTWVFVMMLWK